MKSLALTPGGHTLFAASKDGTTALIDLADPSAPFELSHSLAPVASAAYAPNGVTLAAGGTGLWTVDYTRTNAVRADPVRRACERAGGELNEQAQTSGTAGGTAR